MFTLVRYSLLPIALFCVIVIGAGIDVFSTKAVREFTWLQTTASVKESRDFGDVAAAFRGTPNNFPDPRGTLTYVIDGTTHTWQGRGRDIGLTVMRPGTKIQIRYNPVNHREINTLVLLGATEGSVMLAAALAFLGFYAWFFWLRGFLRRSGRDDFEGR
jgi:hypothetical protein